MALVESECLRHARDEVAMSLALRCCDRVTLPCRRLVAMTKLGQRSAAGSHHDAEAVVSLGKRWRQPQRLFELLGGALRVACAVFSKVPLPG